MGQLCGGTHESNVHPKKLMQHVGVYHSLFQYTYTGEFIVKKNIIYKTENTFGHMRP